MFVANADRFQPVSVATYHQREQTSDCKHEYVNGMVYEMVGGKYSHILIASNVLGILFGQLSNSPCRALNSDSMVRIESETETRVYYPDVSVVCGDDIREGLYQDCPKIVVEVLSESTRRIDETERRDAYLSLESLAAYILLEQDAAAAKIWSRSDSGEFKESVLAGLDATLQLPAINATLSLAAMYANVKFAADPNAGS